MSASARAERSRQVAGAFGVGLAIVLSGALAIGVSYLLPSATTFGSGISEPMVGQVLGWSALQTMGLASLGGTGWYYLSDSRWGRVAVTILALAAVAFVLLQAWGNCLIPHEYCSAIP